LIAFGDASTLQINVTSVTSGAPTSWLGTFKRYNRLMDTQTEAMNGGFIPVSEDELQKKNRGKEERENKHKHQASSFIIGFCDRVSGMNKSMSSHANTSGAQLNINFV
jgi:hypothetical protein